MKTFVLSLFFALVSFTNFAVAAGTDLRTGSFAARWCGFPATVTLSSQDPGTWTFHGEILIQRTGQIDRVKVQQHSDDSLTMWRFLSGSNSGKVQTSRMAVPERLFMQGRRYVVFNSVKNYGPGCQDTRSWLRMLE